MIEATAGAFRLVEEDESAALAQLARAIHLLHPLSREIAAIGDAAAELQEVIYRLQDVARKLSTLSESGRHDPARLEEIEERYQSAHATGFVTRGLRFGSRRNQFFFVNWRLVRDRVLTHAANRAAEWD